MSPADARTLFASPSDRHADAVWDGLRREAEHVLRAEPALATLVVAQVLAPPRFETALARRLAQALGGQPLPVELLDGLFEAILSEDPAISRAARADLRAVVDRDPASGRLLEPFLFFKGFAAVTAHRFAHHLWRRGRRDLALLLQSRSSQQFQVDIHPAATLGQGIFVDHATGLVVGETAVIEDNVSLLQNVTLGGSGIAHGRRHPTLRTGVMVGAGARILGAVEIGAYSKVAAGSVVTTDVPAHSTAVGVPARILVGTAPANPAAEMDQMLTERDYAASSYVI